MAEGKFLKKLVDKTVLVIGGSSGVGFSVACGAIEHGARVVIASSKQEKLDRALATLKDRYPDGVVSSQVCDLGDGSKMEHNLTALFESVGRPVDHIVYTAGDIAEVTPLSQISVDGINKLQTVSYFGPMMVGKLASKYMAFSDSSSIILTTGVSSQRPSPEMAVLASVGAAVEGLTRGLAAALAPIRVNCVSLGAIRTERYDEIPTEYIDKVMEGFVKETFLNRAGNPDEVAEVYLSYMKSTYSTGTITAADGGKLIK
ncbi:hypothetical protein TRICI_000932 [Trichomonascus ciferrii]|uniref:Uncharacterized protein n=1 Tax=Trichomonascus ciferrii TaxID=44093 RepID=A0A642VCR2_9ASCO|nr:hypothetical protein TRICI_000932 [Trichomonascus ciferrii]